MHESLRLALVKCLLDNNKPCVPDTEVAQLPLMRPKGTALGDAVADFHSFLRKRLDPAAGLPIVLGEK
jgi:hypothetical protein